MKALHTSAAHTHATTCLRPHHVRLTPSTLSSRRGSDRLRLQASWSSIDNFQGLAGLLPSNEKAAIFSSLVAVLSVGINAWGSQVLERKRADNAKELAQERLDLEAKQELTSVLAKYRGPLLEATIDLEHKLYHICTGDEVEDEEVTQEYKSYTLFTIAQFLGYVEVVRRESPREVSFLGAGDPQGTDTLNCLVEGFRFFLSASPERLNEWLDGGEDRDHPGCRSRSEIVAVGGKRRVADLDADAVPVLRVSRASQRAIGSVMITTEPGAPRQYTLSYYNFVLRLENDRNTSRWFDSLKEDLRVLEDLPPVCQSWDQKHVDRWTRLLLLQCLCSDAIDILDPLALRVPKNRRTRLSSVKFAAVPSLENYLKQLRP